MASAPQPPATAGEASSSGRGGVTHLAFRETEADGGAPVRTVRIPVKVFSIAARLAPRVVREAMEQHGFDLDAVLAAAREIREPTVLAEVEEHRKGRRIVIAME